MNKNTLMILEKIIKNNFLSIPQLMQETGLSRRQIEYQLSIINSLLADSYSLSPSELLQPCQPISSKALYALENMFFDHSSHYQLNHEERQFYLYLAILCNQDYLSLYHLTSELKVSRSTIQTDLKDLKQQLQAHHITIESDRLLGYTLAGSFSSILQFLIKQIGRFQYSVIPMFLKSRSVQLAEIYRETLHQISLEHSCTFVESRLEEFVYLLVFLSLSSRNYQPDTQKLPLPLAIHPTLLNEYKFAQTLCEKLGLHLDEEKIKYISAWLIGISVSDIQAPTPDREFLVELLTQILSRFQVLSGLEYADYPVALSQLYSHFRPTFYRSLYNIPIINPLTSQILEEYSSTAALVKETIKPLNYIFPTPVTDDEVAYLTMHFASLNTHKSKNALKLKRAVIVCNAGTGFSALLKTQLTELFPEFDFSISSYTALKNSLSASLYQAIFSTSLHFNWDHVSVPVFYISSFLSSRDKYKLAQKVYDTFRSSEELVPSIADLITIVRKHAQITQEDQLRNELVQYFSQGNSPSSHASRLTLTDMIAPCLIQVHVRAGTPLEAIQLSAQPLLLNHFITPGYLDAVINTFQSSELHTVIMDAVALPHAAPEKGALKSGLSITVLEAPVPFDVADYKPVKYIFCLSAVDYESHIDAMAKLVEFLEDPDFYAALDTHAPEQIRSYIVEHS